jgi:hypothetical protein
MKYFSSILVSLVLVSGCVSNKAIQTVQAGDQEMSCVALKNELASLGAVFEEVKDDSGITGKNVGLALVFWPGIIVNEVRANKNQDSIDARNVHLSSIYNGKCLNESSDVQNTTDQLRELKKLQEEGLINDEEHESARKSVLDKL